jgi:hypothetical protein
MPSPFPGMDPFLESQEWEDFHAKFNTAVSDELSQRVEPQYVVRVERRVYVEHMTGDAQARRLDVAVVVSGTYEDSTIDGAPAAATIAPVECLLPIPEEVRETYLVIRARESREIVTVIETLSPTNKRVGSVGRDLYLTKRDEILQSQAHLVEIDLLRGGMRLPMYDPLPPGDFYAIVSRRQRRPRADVYGWTLRDRLPTIRIPLRQDDPEVSLDLQDIFAAVYDRARYQLSVDYAASLVPAPDERTSALLAEILHK